MNFPTSALAAFLASFFCLSAPVVAVNASSSESIASLDAIEEVVVTAEFRNVAVNKVLGSVSLLVPEDRADVANHLEEVLGGAVNVNLASGASRARFVQMRGIGERGQFLSLIHI